MWSLPKLNELRWLAVQQAIRQIFTQIDRLWYAISQTPQQMGMPGASPFTFGLPPGAVPDTGGDSSGTSVELVTLNADFYRGQTVSGQLAGGGNVNVDGTQTYVTGYFFANWTIPCLKIDDTTYVPTQSGRFYEVGTLSANLADTSTATLSLGSGDTITVTGTFGAVDSGKKIGVTWSDRDLKWHAGDARC